MARRSKWDNLRRQDRVRKSGSVSDDGTSGYGGPELAVLRAKLRKEFKQEQVQAWNRAHAAKPTIHKIFQFARSGGRIQGRDLGFAIFRRSFKPISHARYDNVWVCVEASHHCQWMLGKRLIKISRRLHSTKTIWRRLPDFPAGIEPRMANLTGAQKALLATAIPHSDFGCLGQAPVGNKADGRFRIALSVEPPTSPESVHAQAKGDGIGVDPKGPREETSDRRAPTNVDLHRPAGEDVPACYTVDPSQSNPCPAQSARSVVTS